ncbi:uncharacterized protein LOC119604513 [Lucilia sericata]|uniref:uncharacterized protein LOC119604513 n=1 Tax=Lucilia sericata TaxID=13632 RepID=UPI0018A85FD7|nr:uncharacterized protein LOC119604513 [Lucilia sericata]
MAHDHGDQPPNRLVREIVCEADRRHIPLLMGADANAHHTVWGSSDINSRGESLLDFLLDNNLVVVNRGSEPTFIVANRNEVLDITVVNANHIDLVQGWKVSKECSFSDHCYIEFEIVVQAKIIKPFLNRRKTNWEVHKATLTDILPTAPTIESRSDIDLAVNWISSSISVATKRACRLSNGMLKGKPPWWDPEIAKTRRLCRKLFNEAKRSGNWSLYKSKVNEFKNQVRSAKRSSWRKFCSSIENSSDTSRLRKILSKSPSVPSYIQKADGNWTAGSQETLELLLNTHFPGCIPTGESIADNQHGIELDNTAEDVMIDDDIIRWAIRSFDTYKSPGPDGIIPADLQNNLDRIIPWLNQNQQEMRHNTFTNNSQNRQDNSGFFSRNLNTRTSQQTNISSQSMDVDNIQTSNFQLLAEDLFPA